MNNLQELILHKNKITVIIKDIVNLKKLQILDLQDNNLQILPEQLLTLPNLKKLDLRKNPALANHKKSTEIIKELKNNGVNVKY
jgi:Leucine-rich repeat (LRR) protein